MLYKLRHKVLPFKEKVNIPELQYSPDPRFHLEGSDQNYRIRPKKRSADEIKQVLKLPDTSLKKKKLDLAYNRGG